MKTLPSFPLVLPWSRLSDKERRFGLAMLFFAILAFILPPFAQPQQYHHFVDERSIAGIPRAMDVLSNLGFLAAGAWGFFELARRRASLRQGYALPLAIFFLGVLGTAAGSSYYHWAPQDSRLVWDRLPMTVAFAGVCAALAAVRVSTRCAPFVLAACLAYGLGSIALWRATGNLTPYAVMQFGGLAWVAVAWVGGARRERDLPWGALLGFYLAAKLMESFDGQVFAATMGLISGHTVKHLLSAAAAASFAWALSRGRLDRDPPSRP